MTVIEDRNSPAPGFLGFTRAGLLPHTDCSGTAQPPEILVAVCAAAPRHGGEALLVDGQAVFEDLLASAPDAVWTLSQPRTVLFGGSDGHLGSVFTTGSDGRTRVRCRFDALARFSPTAQPYLSVLRAAVERHTRVIPIRAGSGYVLDNHRWLHGRTAFQGDHRVYRVLVDPGPGVLACGFPVAPGARAASSS